jgi:hypothetical protein
MTLIEAICGILLMLALALIITYSIFWVIAQITLRFFTDWDELERELTRKRVPEYPMPEIIIRVMKDENGRYIAVRHKGRGR